MARRVAVSEAARVLGLARCELQRLIRSGDLDTFEGRVDLSALQARFPELAMKTAPFMERLELIRTTAFSRRVRETVLPDGEELAAQLRRANSELSVARGRADRYEKILRDLAQRLGDLQRSELPEQREAATEISRWLLEQMKR